MINRIRLDEVGVSYIPEVIIDSYSTATDAYIGDKEIIGFSFLGSDIVYTDGFLNRDTTSNSRIAEQREIANLRQTQCGALTMAGLSNIQIGERIGVGPDAVRDHVKSFRHHALQNDSAKRAGFLHLALTIEPPIMETSTLDPVELPEYTVEQVTMLNYIAKGLTNRQIAHKLGTDVGRIKTSYDKIARHSGFSERELLAAIPALYRLQHK